MGSSQTSTRYCLTRGEGREEAPTFLSAKFDEWWGAGSPDYRCSGLEEREDRAQHRFDFSMIYACHVVFVSDELHFLRVPRLRIGTESHLLLTVHLGTFLKRAFFRRAYWILACTNKLLDLMRAMFVILSLSIQREFAAQVADFNHDEEGQERDSRLEL